MSGFRQEVPEGDPAASAAFIEDAVGAGFVAHDVATGLAAIGGMGTVTTFPSFSAGHHAVPEIVPSGAQFR